MHPQAVTLTTGSVAEKPALMREIEPAPYLVLLPGEHPPVAVPPELEVERVRTPETLEEFEKASFEGYESTGLYKPGSLHAPASVDDPDMPYFIGRVDGQVVSTSIAVISDGVVGFLG